MSDNFKNKILAITRRRKPDLERRLAKARITVQGYILRFNTKTTYWLAIYLDT